MACGIGRCLLYLCEDSREIGGLFSGPLNPGYHLGLLLEVDRGQILSYDVIAESDKEGSQFSDIPGRPGQ